VTDFPRTLGSGALWVAVLAVAIAILLDQFVSVWKVAGVSMEPALREGDRVLVDVWSYRRRPPRIGEVALLVAPAGVPVVKRVATAPIDAAAPGTTWVLGDSPDASGDSRKFGAVPDSRFRGRVVWRYWPPARFGAVGVGAPGSETRLRLPGR
jgi:nickel-type superoxide dismutase maturation protease